MRKLALIMVMLMVVMASIGCQQQGLTEEEVRNIVQAMVAEPQSQITELKRQNTSLERRVAELEQQLTEMEGFTLPACCSNCLSYASLLVTRCLVASFFVY